MGNIPLGLSLQEARLGMFLPTPFLIRLPFVLMGIVSIYVFYLLVKRMFGSEKVALVSSFLLAVLPWHVAESRIFSWGIIMFLAFEIIAFAFSKLSKHYILIGCVLALVCIIVPVKGLANSVNDERLLVTNTSPKILSRVFINKVTENYRQRQKILFTNLDFGNYFFSGHPRERGGVEETQKLLLFTLPFILLGLFKIGSDKGKFLITWTIVSLFVLTLLNLQGSQTLIMIMPLTVLASVGFVESLSVKKKIVRVLIIIVLAFGLFEIIYFYNSYFKGFGESQFSSRRPIYIDLSSKIKETRRVNEKVLVNDRIGDPKEFLNFYLGKNIEGFEFKSFDYHKESETGKLFIDILPDDPISNEPLYTNDGTWPENLNILGVLYDTGRRQKVVIYRTK